jgi:hypothetical protein
LRAVISTLCGRRASEANKHASYFRAKNNIAHYFIADVTAIALVLIREGEAV